MLIQLSSFLGARVVSGGCASIFSEPSSYWELELYLQCFTSRNGGKQRANWVGWYLFGRHNMDIMDMFVWFYLSDVNHVRPPLTPTDTHLVTEQTHPCDLRRPLWQTRWQ